MLAASFDISRAASFTTSISTDLASSTATDAITASMELTPDVAMLITASTIDTHALT